MFQRDLSNEPTVEEAASVKIAFENDGTSTRESYDRIRIQSEAGVQQFSVAVFAYEASTENLKIDYVRVKKPDGTLVVTPLDNVQDVPADTTRQAPLYSDLREQQVAVKGLGVGDTLEMQARWQVTKPLAPGQFWFAFSFLHDNIVLDEKVQISVPRDRAIKYDSPGYQPAIVTDGNHKIFTWSFSQLHSKSADEQKKEQDEQTYLTATGQLPAPDVQISTFQTWQEVGAWYDALQRDRIIPDASIRAKAAELIKGAGDDDAKIRAIYNFVSTQVRYIGLDFGIGRYQPHAAAEILANRYGDCKDEHTLLASLLSAVGIKAYPVLINSEHRIDLDVPSPAQFDHLITAVPRSNGFVWLDTTPQVAPYGLLLSSLRGKTSLVIPDGGPATMMPTPSAAPEPAIESFKIDATLSDDGILKGSVVRTVTGGDSEVLLRSAFRSVSMAQWKQLVQRLSYMGGFAGDVSDVTVSPPDEMNRPVTVSYIYTRKDFPQWSEHRIAVALPPVIGAPYDEKPSHPVLLGEAGTEFRYESRVVVPAGYSPQAPAPVDLNEPFAAYHASYSVEKGALHVTRTLVLKVREVPLAQFDAFEAFLKAVQNDYQLYVACLQTHITPSSFPESLGALPESTDPAAASAFDEARNALGKSDAAGGISSLKRAVQIDPKFTLAWLSMSQVYFWQRNFDDGLAALRSAVANDPKQPLAYKGLGFALMNESHYDDAALVWRQLMKIAPDDPDAPLYLGTTLLAAKRYADAAAAFETAAKINPKSPEVRTQLGSAYLQAGDESKAMPAFKMALELDSSPLSLNNIGWALADANKQLPLALDYAQKAVQQEEELSAKVKLPVLTNQDLAHAPSLAAYWDTLGWVYFRMGQLDEAEKFLNAAWVLSQATDMGDHLAHVYAQEHRKKEAIHMINLAFSTARDPQMAGDLMDLLFNLGGQDETKVRKSEGGAELSQLRTFDVPSLKATKGSAEFFLLFGASPSGPKVEDVKFVTGSDDLKDAGKFLSATDFKVLFPDQGPERLLRRGILMCDPLSHCTFVFYPISSVRSVD
ncbi:MAG TPA: DUF3857 domain-containing protein [Candidatus Limnocylindrales bacterium]|nr:DUF3857 domain-containing protein [Candidatus Limnocylindrales bacterium]